MKDLVVFSDVESYFDSIVEVKQIEFGERNLPDFNNKVRKMLFFALREGLRETFKKYKSLKWYNQHLEKYATYLLVKKNNELYLNCSLQSQENKEHFIISNSFIKLNDMEHFNNIVNQDVLKDNFSAFSNQYDSIEQLANEIDDKLIVPIKHKSPKSKETKEGLFIFGLGGYTFTHVLPNLKRLPRIACVDYKYGRSKLFAEKFNFEYHLLHSFQSKQLLLDVKNPVVVIATYHSDHSSLAKWIFDINPNAYIFVEKPPCLTEMDLKYLQNIYHNNGNIEVGFNRRYVKINQNVKKTVQGKKLFITFSIKEVLIKNNHWYNWSNQGTRLSGNLVHWIDLGNYWVDSNPTSLVMNFSEDSLDDFTLSISYSNGSLVNITCSDKGNSLRGVQELAEIRFNQETILIQDNLTVRHIKSNGKSSVKKYLIRDKGHSNMYKEFMKNIQGNKSFNYSLTDLERVSIITTKASQMLKNKINFSRL